MRGIFVRHSPHHIADKLNEDGVPIPSDYYYAKLGKPNPRRTRHMWSPETVRQILHNYTYLGHLVQLRTRTVSYKNHKVIKNDDEDMIVVKNTHEPIVSQELWDRVREIEQSVSQGKRNSSGYVANLSSLIYCQDCGNKVRLAWNNTTNGSKKKPRKYLRHNYNCTSYMKFGKRYCPSHYIKMQDMDAIVLEDIRSLAQLVVEDEEKAKAEFLARKAKHHEEQYSVDTKKLTEGRFRLQELTREMCLVSRLMPMSRGSPVRSTSTTNCSMNHSKTREACFKAYLRYLSTIRKCVTIWQEDYR